MASLNKVMLIGYLGKDPELKYTPSGVAVCSFSLATTERFTDKDGNAQEKTEWHNIKIWKKQAEIAAEYLKKGKQVYIDGRIETRSWEKDGQKHYITEIIVNRFLMLGTKPEGSAQGAPPANRPAAAPRPGSAPTPMETPPPDDFDGGDIPF